MSDTNTNMADLETDDMSMVFAVNQTDSVIFPQYQAARNRNYSGSDSGSDSGKEESNIDNSNKLLVSGSANTVVATTTLLESDDMSLTTAVLTQQVSEHQTESVKYPQDQFARNQNLLGSDSGSGSGKEESNIDSSNKLLVSGSANTVDATMACSKESVTNDRQKSAYSNYQSNSSQTDTLVITGKRNEWHIHEDNNQKDSLEITDKRNEWHILVDEVKNYTSIRKTFDSPYWSKELSANMFAIAGMIYKGPCNTNGETVYDMVECCECHKTMYGFKPDEDPLAEHMKLHPECKRFQE